MNFLNKKYYISVGLVFLLLSFALFGASALFYLDPVQSVNYERVKSGAIASCSKSFNGKATYMGLQTEIAGDKVLFTAYGLEEWEGKFNMASHIVSSCGGMSLNKFCFGEDCNIAKLTGNKAKPSFHTGMFMELKFEDKNIDPRIKNTWE